MAELVRFTPDKVRLNGHNGHKEASPSVVQVLNGKERRKPPYSVIDSLGTIQAVEWHFSTVAVHDEEHPDLIMRHMGTEIDELKDAIKTGDRKEIASELPDVFLQIVRLANFYKIPLDIAVSDKIARNAAKYPPETIRDMKIEHGMSTQEAMDVLRSKWDKSRDFGEFCRSCGRPS